MYAKASRTMQHAHRVDLPHPARGFIMPGDRVELPPLPTMSIRQLQDERQQLLAELVQTEQHITIAKSREDTRAVSQLRQRKMTLEQRIAQVKAATAAKNAGSVWDRFMTAAREIVGEVDAARIEARVHQGSAR